MQHHHALLKVFQKWRVTMGLTTSIFLVYKINLIPNFRTIKIIVIGKLLVQILGVRVLIHYPCFLINFATFLDMEMLLFTWKRSLEPFIFISMPFQTWKYLQKTFGVVLPCLQMRFIVFLHHQYQLVMFPKQVRILICIRVIFSGQLEIWFKCPKYAFFEQEYPINM